MTDHKEKDLQAFQDYYPDDYSHCYGCGRLNENGMQIKSYWEGEESICRVHPKDHYTGGMKGILYGGLIASLIDCHGAGTAAAAKARELRVNLENDSMPRFVTASLKVDYLAPTPVGKPIDLKGRVLSIEGRKVVVTVDLLAENKVCAKGEGLFIQVRDDQ